MIARDTKGNLWLYPCTGDCGWQNGVQIGWGWNVMTRLAAVGDYDNDGKGDVIAQDASGTMWLYPGNGNGGFTGQRWALDIRGPKPFG